MIIHSKNFPIVRLYKDDIFDLEILLNNILNTEDSELSIYRKSSGKNIYPYMKDDNKKAFSSKAFFLYYNTKQLKDGKEYEIRLFFTKESASVTAKTSNDDEMWARGVVSKLQDFFGERKPFYVFPYKSREIIGILLILAPIIYLIGVAYLIVSENVFSNFPIQSDWFISNKAIVLSLASGLLSWWIAGMIFFGELFPVTVIYTKKSRMGWKSRLGDFASWFYEKYIHLTIIAVLGGLITFFIIRAFS